ncbi:hypothetical protein QR98_0020260 [Sarcoptes scabiei]|uniref:Uncharacterized protein n=1 Tax=Sarcoptes scabiei TaxID=52283 RepID=A0A131ZY33_SARSC|nr:hypothetical protein QR98_0020260 [Sarcoptes scabiei]
MYVASEGFELIVESGGKFKKIKKNATIWTKYPVMTIGSRLLMRTVRDPKIPNIKPPTISPTPISIPARPTYFLASSESGGINTTEKAQFDSSVPKRDT